MGEGEGEALAADGLGEDLGFVVSVVEVVTSIFPSLCFVLSNLPYSYFRFLEMNERPVCLFLSIRINI